MNNWHVSLTILSTPLSKVRASSSARTHDRQLIDLPFQDIPLYTIQRETRRARCRNDWSIPDLTKCVPLGLPFLHRLVLARTPGERYRVLSPQSFTDEVFFYGWGVPVHYDHPPLSKMNEEEQRKWVNPPASRDGNGGPEAAWRWAHADHCRACWYNSPACRHLREWGYVMWDYDRLDSCGVFGMDWRLLEKPVNHLRLVDSLMRSLLATNVTTLIDSGRG